MKVDVAMKKKKNFDINANVHFLIDVEIEEL